MLSPVAFTLDKTINPLSGESQTTRTLKALEHVATVRFSS